MARIVIASLSEEGRNKLSRLLGSSGFQVFRVCTLGSDLRRALSESEDCILIMIGFSPDCRPDDLIWDYGNRIQILLIAKQEMLDRVESRDIFRLPLPASGQTVLGAVEMLSQLHQMRLPHREGESKALVDRAKATLMKQQGLSEPEAYRAMQRRAMNQGVRMVDMARRILDAGEGKAP